MQSALVLQSGKSEISTNERERENENEGRREGAVEEKREIIHSGTAVKLL